MLEEELNQIIEYAQRDALNAEEMIQLKLLLLKWMYEQGIVD